MKTTSYIKRWRCKNKADFAQFFFFCLRYTLILFYTQSRTSKTDNVCFRSPWHNIRTENTKKPCMNFFSYFDHTISQLIFNHWLCLYNNNMFFSLSLLQWFLPCILITFGVFSFTILINGMRTLTGLVIICKVRSLYIVSLLGYFSLRKYQSI